MQRRNSRSLVTGLLYVVIGGSFAFASAGYRIGTPAAMGPGFFPFWVGLLLVAVGGGLFLSGLRAGGDALAFPDMRVLVPVTLSAVLFAALLRPLGLPLTVVICTLVAANANRENRWRETALLALILATGAVLLFKLGLGLQFAILPPTLAALMH